jgi:hypothetical protein
LGLGLGRSSDLQWAEISLQAEALCDHPVKKEEINLKFFLLSLQYHCIFTSKNSNLNSFDLNYLKN